MIYSRVHNMECLQLDIINLDKDNSVKLNLTLILFNKERKWYIINLLVMTFGLINKLTVCQNGF